MFRLLLVLRSIVYYRRNHFASLLSIAVTSAVITGSLLIGYSVDRTLYGDAMERIGDVDFVLRATTMFREELAADIAAHDAMVVTLPVIYLNGSAHSPGKAYTAPKVNLLGLPDAAGKHRAFFNFQSNGMEFEKNGAIINRNVADELKLSVGDDIIVSVPKMGQAPADSVLGRRSASDSFIKIRVTVTKIIFSRGPARFSLRPDEHDPRNIFVSLSFLQQALNETGKANLILTKIEDHNRDVNRMNLILNQSVSLSDYGLYLKRINGGYALKSNDYNIDSSIYDHIFHMTGSTLNYDTHAPEYRSFYVINSLSAEGGRPIPYSLVCGFFNHEKIGKTSIPKEGMLLNRWAYEQLKPALGQLVETRYFTSSATGGLIEKKMKFKFAGTVEMDVADEDGQAVPDYPGLTDSDKISDWDPPFPVDMSRIRPADEGYWQKYRTAPMAYINEEILDEMWLGDSPQPYVKTVSSIILRVNNTREKVDRVLASCIFSGAMREANLGLRFIDFRSQAIGASRSPTDYTALFLSLGGFIIIAGLVLIYLVTRLDLNSRIKSVGLMKALGHSKYHIMYIYATEFISVCIAGSVIGLGVAVLYSKIMLGLLSGVWSGAVAGYPLQFYFSWHLAVSGFCLTIFSSLFALIPAAIKVLSMPPKKLIYHYGEVVKPSAKVSGKVMLFFYLSIPVMTAAIFSYRLQVIGPVYAFVIIGIALLVFMLTLFRIIFSLVNRLHPSSLNALSLRQIGLYPTRSMAVVSVVAFASFTVFTVSFARSDASRSDVRDVTSGSGGFDLIVRTTIPVRSDISTQEGRSELKVVGYGDTVLSGAKIFSLAVHDGENAGCLNLNSPQSPRIVGIPRTLIERGGFRFKYPGRTWLVLDRSSSFDSSVSAILDASSAQWIMKKKIGADIMAPNSNGATVQMKLQSLLSAGSIFPGEVLIGMSDFRRYFREDEGFRMFLVRSNGDIDKTAKSLHNLLQQFGVQVVSTRRLLSDYASVQNTYLSTFEALGGIGLLLGLFGVAFIVLRNIADRRQELALLSAVGYTRLNLFGYVLCENILLVAVGLLIGGISSAVAMYPQLSGNPSSVSLLAVASIMSGGLVVTFMVCLVAVFAGLRGRLTDSLRSE